jgi:hypothetical protein
VKVFDGDKIKMLAQAVRSQVALWKTAQLRLIGNRRGSKDCDAQMREIAIDVLTADIAAGEEMLADIEQADSIAMFSKEQVTKAGLLAVLLSESGKDKG